jgi:ubiquinone/menaquinone biosynthesis C-methylase UbiE
MVKMSFVLDVGSGHQPYPKADILVDLFVADDFHRDKVPLKINGKPFICADASSLPFIDKIFRFVICRHVLEHTDNPVEALEELKRVGRHGFVSTPSPLWESLFNRTTPLHKWTISDSKRVRTTKTGIIRALKHLTYFLWERNWRIRLRERWFTRILTRIGARETIFRW